LANASEHVRFCSGDHTKEPKRTPERRVTAETRQKGSVGGVFLFGQMRRLKGRRFVSSSPEPYAPILEYLFHDQPTNGNDGESNRDGEGGPNSGESCEHRI
jgi:hypothetical protein